MRRPHTQRERERERERETDTQTNKHTYKQANKRTKDVVVGPEPHGGEDEEELDEAGAEGEDAPNQDDEGPG
jgi:hypothetical protein